MKDYPGLSAGARLFNNQSTGYIIVQFEDFNGGPFGLQPKLTADGLVLVDPGRPAGYGVEIRGSSPGALRRVARALNDLAAWQDSTATPVAE